MKKGKELCEIQKMVDGRQKTKNGKHWNVKPRVELYEYVTMSLSHLQYK